MIRRPIKPTAFESTDFVAQVPSGLSLEAVAAIAAREGIKPNEAFIDVFGSEDYIQLYKKVIKQPTDDEMREYRKQLAAYNNYLKTGVDSAKIEALRLRRQELEKDLRRLSNKLSKLTKSKSKKTKARNNG